MNQVLVNVTLCFFTIFSVFYSFFPISLSPANLPGFYGHKKKRQRSFFALRLFSLNLSALHIRPKHLHRTESYAPDLFTLYIEIC